MLALGLVGAFSTVSFAQLTVKNSGEFYVAGMYLDRTSLQKDVGPSTAFYFQRLRVRTDFTVTPGLTLTTRFDALERSWGATRNNSATTTLASDSAGTRAENENIAFDWAYVTYKSPIGVFDAGYMNDGATGTIFGNSYGPKGRIKYSNTFGPVKIDLAYTKEREASRTAINTVNTADADNDKYGIGAIYSWKDGRAGIQANYYNFANNRPADNYRRKYFLFTPYAIAKFGPVALQAELNYLTGKQEYEAPSITADRDLQNITGWVDATASFGLFYAGGSIAYVSGDNPGSDKIEGGIINGGRDWNPCLIMWNYDRTNWAGNLRGYNNAAQDTAMSNAWFFQGRAGVKPVANLDVMASVSYAMADKKPWATAGDPTSVYVGDVYGWEVDVTATYKITQNLYYMLGVGYLFTGDYYKGASDVNQLTNDYLVVNKLTLTF
jgi:hypothetical protein